MDSLRKFDRKVLGGVAVALALALFVALNALSTATLTSARLDLTENRLYTLSDGTRQVLSAIGEPIVVRLYISKTLTDLSPGHAKYAQRVREYIENAAALSRGMLKVRVINPEPYSEAEDEALAFGLQGVPLTKAGDEGYFGLAATNSTDDQGVIPFFNPEREAYLEYDLTRMVYDLAHPKKKVVGLITSLMMTADPTMNQRPWTVVEQMREFFDVRILHGDLDKIDDDVGVLMIVQPARLGDKTKYAIDQYMMKGGKAMVFVDPHSESAAVANAMMRMPGGATNSNFDPFLAAWGIDYDPEAFVGDRARAVRVSSEHRGRQVTSDYLAWLEYGAANLNADDVVTAQLSRIAMAGAGAVKLKEGTSGLEFTPLIVSSPRTQMIAAEKIRMAPDPVGLLQDFKSDGQVKVLAARIRGSVKSAFPDGAPAPKEGAAKPDPQAPHLTESAAPMTLVLVADTDMLTDRFWLREQQFFGQRVVVPAANNADFVINALEVLTGSDALIGLRSRGISDRPFVKVEEIRKAAETTFLQTQRELEAKMRATEEKLGKIRSDAEGGAILTDDQKATIEGFRTELISIRQQLRDVKHELRKDIESLDVWLKVVNIWAMPVLVSIVAVVMAVVGRVRRRRAAA